MKEFFNDLKQGIISVFKGPAKEENLFKIDGRPPLKRAIPFGIQHILAMFVANITPLLIVFGALGIFNTPLATQSMLGSLFMAGIGTVIQLLIGDMSDEESSTLSKAKEAMYRDACIHDPTMFHLVEGLPALLDTLKELGIPMTICSASIKENIDFFISSFQLDKWFDIEHIMYDDGIHLNKISMFQEGAKAIGVDIKDCIVIEDSISGIDFAHQCQVDSIIAIGPKEKHSFLKTLPGVKHVIRDYEDASWIYDYIK